MIIYHVPKQISGKYSWNSRVGLRALYMQCLIYLAGFQRPCWYHNIRVSVHTIILKRYEAANAKWRHALCSRLPQCDDATSTAHAHDAIIYIIYVCVCAVCVSIYSLRIRRDHELTTMTKMYVSVTVYHDHRPLPMEVCAMTTQN